MHSGNTEETLSAFKQAKAQGTKVLAVTTGGKLKEEAEAYDNGATMIFDYPSQPRAAVGYSFGMLLAALAVQFVVDGLRGLGVLE